MRFFKRSNLIHGLFMYYSCPSLHSLPLPLAPPPSLYCHHHSHHYQYHCHLKYKCLIKIILPCSLLLYTRSSRPFGARKLICPYFLWPSLYLGWTYFGEWGIYSLNMPFLFFYTNAWNQFHIKFLYLALL